MKINQLCFFLTFFFFVSVSVAEAQTDSILLGSQLTSSNNTNFTYYNNYKQIKDLGLKFILQRAIIPIAGKQSSNFDSLSLFSTIGALNDTASVHAKYSENIDWVYYYSNALYSKWEMEGSPYFSSNEAVGIKASSWVTETSSEISTGINPSNIGKYLFTGPNYSQYMKYVYTNKYESNPLVTYNAAFRLKKGTIFQGGSNVCKLFAKAIDYSNGNEYILDSLIITKDTLSTTYKDFILTYDYYDLINTMANENYSGALPSQVWYAPQSAAQANWFNENVKIQFQVQWLGNAELFVDCVEVYDQEIWKSWFNIFYNNMRTNILNYNQQFSSLNTKLKYYLTIDEPHSIDCFEPIRKVQFILDSLGINKELLIQFYPGWNNYRDSVDILEKFYNMAQPKKLWFWYYPFWADNTDEFGLNQTRGIFQRASLLTNQTNGFYWTAQSFGYNDGNNFYYYRTPTPAQLSAETMLGLAHGVRSISFYTYYSYLSWLEGVGNVPVEAIVDLNYQPRDLYYKISSLSNRLGNNFGTVLTNSKYSNNYIYVTDSNHADNSEDFLTIQHYGLDYNWHAGILNNKTDQENKYFLLVNLRTDTVRTAELLIANNSGYNNLRVKNVEDSALDTTVTTSACTLYQTLQAGDGKLYQIAPVVKYGGKIKTSDTISQSISLLGELTVESGATLTISADYDIYKNITINAGGSIVVSAGKQLKFYDGSYLTVNGNLTANGLPNNKITFTRGGTTGTWGGIRFNQGSTGSMQNCIISYATNGITCNYSLPSISYNTIQYNQIGIYLNMLGTTTTEITGNVVRYNTMRGIYLYYSSPRIYDNEIYNNSSYGIWCYSYSSPILVGNTISGHTSSGLYCSNYSAPHLASWGGGTYWGPGYNVIQNNTGFGIYSTYYSNLFLGGNPYGGHNSIHDNASYEFKASYNCTIMAEITWWGSHPPNSSEFYTYQSTIDYTPADSFDYNEGDPSSVVTSGSSTFNLSKVAVLGSQVEKAFMLQLEGKYEEAIAIYSDFISNNSMDSNAAYALIRIEECYDQINKTGFVDYLKQSVTPNLKSTDELFLVSLELENKYLLANSQYERVINNLDKIQKTLSSNAEGGKYALYNMGVVYLKFLNDIENAKKAFSDLAAKYPNDDLTEDSKYLLSEYINQKLPKTENEQADKNELDGPSVFGLSQNYPNPFNPTTKISYQLPIDAQVIIKVYDLLGREVSTLVNEEKHAGKYEVGFNASNLSSGVYLYKITMNDFTKTMKMMVVK